MRSLIPFFALALAWCPALGCAAPRDAVAQRDEPVAHTLFAPANEPLELGSADGIALDELVQRYRRATGRVLTVDEALTEQLVERLVCVDGRTTVPESIVQDAFEAVLEAQGYFLVRRVTGYEVELLLTVPPANDPGWLQRVAMPVPIERLDGVRGHAALLVATLVELPSSDVVTLRNQLGHDLRNFPAEDLIAVPDTSAMLVLGTGRRVADRVDVLRGIDALNAAAAGGATR